MRLIPKDPDLGWAPYAYLLYLLLFFIQPLAGRTSTREWVLTALGTAAFLVLYFTAYWCRGRWLIAIIVAITALGLAFAPFNVGASVLFIYAASFAGFAGSSQVAIRIIGSIVAVTALEAAALRLPPEFWITAIVFSVFIGGLNIHYAQRKIANAKLRRANEEIERLAKVAERERIARDLHDLLGHTLSLIVLKAELAGKLVDRDPSRARVEIRDLEKVSREALSEVRQAVGGIRSGDLAAELVRARAALETAGIRVQCANEPLPLTSDQETVLAMVVREGVTNVVRHSKATNCEIHVRRQNGLASIEIIDDGCGGSMAEGNGLRGMRERVEGIGGSIRREVGPGSKLRVFVPIAETNQA
jgi:two-component system sensor histidine kinase DesK